MIVGTYYTDERYKAYADRLAVSARAVGLECRSVSVPDTGSWERNVNLKPKAILELLAATKEDLLYIDADAELRALPLLASSHDRELACVFVQGRPVSATLFVRNSPGGRQIVKAWAEECEAHPDEHDDVVNLAAVLRRIGGKRATYLPPSYYWHEKTMRPRFPTAVPVVEHFNVGEHTFSNEKLKQG